MLEVKCIMEFNEKTSTVTIRHAKTRTIQMVIKLEDSCGINTMTRISPEVDCDNFWIGIKPYDSTVFNDNLFGKTKLVVKTFEFDINNT